MKVIISRVFFGVLVLAMGTFAYFSLKGSNGVLALMKKHEEIRDVERQNGELARQNQAKLDRIRKLRESRAEQELEIRERLKMLRKGETSFVLPETNQPQPGANPATPAAPAIPGGKPTAE